MALDIRAKSRESIRKSGGITEVDAGVLISYVLARSEEVILWRASKTIGEQMEKGLTGRCLCGDVQYEYKGEPEGASYCHCYDCRRATGGAYTVGVLTRAAKLRIISGNVKGYTSTGDSGKKITREFCPQCGSPLFTRAELFPELVWIKAGSLDEPELIKPTQQIWTQCAVPWAYLSKDLPGSPKGS